MRGRDIAFTIFGLSVIIFGTLLIVNTIPIELRDRVMGISVGTIRVLSSTVFGIFVLLVVYWKWGRIKTVNALLGIVFGIFMAVVIYFMVLNSFSEEVASYVLWIQGLSLIAGAYIGVAVQRLTAEPNRA